MVGKNNEQPTDRFKKKTSDTGDTSSNLDFSRESDEQDDSRKWFDDGLKALEKQDYKEAIRLLNKVVRVDPDNLTAYEKLTIAKSIQADIDSVEEFIAIGKDCMKHQDWAGAAEEFRSALGIVPDHSTATKLLAEVTPYLKETRRLEKVTQSDLTQPTKPHTPDSPPVHTQEENVPPYRYKEPDPDQYQVEDLNVINMDIPDTSSIEKKLGDAIALYEAGDLQGAQKQLLALKSKVKDHSQIDYYLRIIESKFVDSKSSQDQETVERLLKEGMDDLEANKITDAIGKFEEALRIKPDFEQARSMLERANVLKSPKPKPVKVPEPENKQAPVKTAATTVRNPPLGSSNPAVKISIAAALLILLGILGYFIFVMLPNIKAENLMKQAKVLISENRDADAHVKLVEFLKIKPDNLDGLMLAGTTAQKSGNFPEAIRFFTEASTKEPKNLSIVLSLGETYLLANQLDAAEKSLTQAAGDPAIAKKAYLSLGITLTRQNKKESAVEALRKVIELDPDSAQAHYELGRILEDKSAPETAEVEYLAAIEKNSKYTDAFEALGTFYLTLERPDPAIEILNQPLMWLKTSRPNETEIINRIRILLGQAYYLKGEYDNAIDQYNKVLLLTEDLNASIELGRAYYKQNKDQAAIIAWQKALKLEPNNADINFRIGRAYHRLSDYKAAIDYYNNAIRLDPKHSQAYANLGFVYQSQNKIPQARESWETSLRLNPEQPFVINELKKLQADKLLSFD